MSSSSKGRIDLTGVPETMLWPLWNRAAEMQRADRLIEDEMAAALVRQIEYDFAAKFGKPTVFHPIRARVCDDLVRRYLSANPDMPTVVALGEGLETQLWRIADPRIRWITVDLPEAIELRERLLPAEPMASSIACSALDESWMDAVPAQTTPFVSAAGLLMYFKEAEVRSLLEKIASRFPGADVFFDTITPHVSAKTLNGWKVTKHYTAPPMPWGITIDDLPAFIDSIPGMSVGSLVSYGDRFPERTRLYNLLGKIGWIRRRFAGALVHAKVAQGV